MASSVFQGSKIGSGEFVNGIWFCGCGLETKWLTSRTDATRGQKFSKCPQSAPEGCNFFLWDKDDALARYPNDSEGPAAPQTPTHVRQLHNEPRTPSTNPSKARAFAVTSQPASQGPEIAQSMPTPESRVGHHSRGPQQAYQRPDMSPTPKRYGGALPHPDGSADMTQDVLDVLWSSRLILKPSVEVQLRHIIDMGISVYEAKLHQFQETLSKLQERLNDLETARALTA